jgi:tRNA(Ile)-lysidine synthase
MDMSLTRNRLRHSLLPLLQADYGAGVTSTLAKSAELASLDEHYLVAHARQALVQCILFCGPGCVALDATELANLHGALSRRVLRTALWLVCHADIYQCHIDAALAISFGKPGKHAVLCGGVVAKKQRHALVIRTNSTPSPRCQSFQYNLTLNTAVFIKETDSWALASLQEPQGLPPNAVCCTFAHEGRHLVLRSRQPKDKIFSHKLGGTQKLQDYFVNTKTPKEQRDGVALLAHDSNVLWILDKRGLTNDRFKPQTSSGHILYVAIWRHNK